MRRSALTGAAMAALAFGTAACVADGGTESLPSSRPTVEITIDRTSSSPRITRETATAEPTRESTRTESTRETATTEPTRETRTTEPAREPATTEPTREPATTEPARAATTPAEAAPTPAQTSTSAAAAAAADDSDGSGALAWILLFALFAGVIAFLLINRSRRGAAWRAESAALAAETRTAVAARLRPVLAEHDPAGRTRSWAPVRDDLAALVARWADLSTRGPETADQAAAAQVAGVLRDLVNAVDAETDAVASHYDWQLLRPDVDASLQALAAVLPASPPGAVPPPEPGPAAYSG